MSGQDSSSGRRPSDYSSELHGAVPALVSSDGSVRTETTPMTSSSSEPGVPPHASPSPDQAMLVAPQAVPAVHGGLQEHQGPQGERPGTEGYLAASPKAPNPVRFPGGADAELNRRLADHDRGARHDATRERSREYRDQADAGEHRGRGQAFQERLVPDLAERGLDLVQRHSSHTPC